MKDKLKFNRRRKFKSNSLYRFNRYIDTFERSSRVLFNKSYYKLESNRVKYYCRLNPFRNKSKDKLNGFTW